MENYSPGDIAETIRKTLMGYVDSGVEFEGARQLWVATEQVARARMRVEQARHRAMTAQRSATYSLERSAASHDRIALLYEEIGRERDQEHATRHHKFAHEDRLMAERLRASTEIRWDAEVLG